ncbi:MAG TPA: hypothetical protein DCE71_00930 [Parachlamydiales bacterium]|nr:hypothetical protein [Parachlamydiales bacterium]
MNPINDVKQPPIIPQPLETSDFLTFLEEIKGLLEELNETISDASNRCPCSSAIPSKFDHQVKILMNFEKNCSEMEALWREIKEEATPLQILKKGDKTAPNTGSFRPAPLSEISQKGREAPSSALADLSEKKEREVFQVPKSSSERVLKTEPISPQNPQPSARLPGNTRRELSPLFPQPDMKPSLLAPFFPASSLPLNTLDRLPAAELWQKIKPLLEHLIVVVETQENMSNPSQKLVNLIRLSLRNHTSFTNLDVSSLIKTPQTAKPLEPAHVSTQQKTFQEKAPEAFSLKSQETFSSLSIAKPTELDPSFPVAPRPSSQTHQPFAAPYTAEKKIEERKKTQKKKRKGFWSSKDPEEEKNLP